MLKIIELGQLRAGDIACVRGTSLISRLIMFRTRGRWSHDALVVERDGKKYFGDALMGHRAALSEPEEWERWCRDEGARIIFLRPAGVTAEDGRKASDWWLENVMGREYDVLGIWHLVYRALADRFGRKVGDDERFYCTEGCRDAWKHGASFNPWSPKLNVTPGTTYKRLLSGKMIELHKAITFAGQRHAI